MKHLLPILAGCLCLCGCATQPQSEEPTLYVSIQPLRSLVRGIVGDDFAVETLVPRARAPRPSSRRHGRSPGSTARPSSSTWG